MYSFRDPAREVRTGPVPDYAAVSHAGHSVNSYASNYHLVYRSLALFAQVSWGGVYTGRPTAAVAKLFDHCQALIDAVEEQPPAETSPWRLVCQYSSFRSRSRVGWTMVPQDGVVPAELAGHSGGPVLAEAERLVRAGPPH